MRFPCLVLFVLLAHLSTAQKVALVLSGGGAKGIAHVGVLKALEENEIPIDYIVGTSMGGIVGGAYAAGMSPDKIESLILSDAFMRWIMGVAEKGHNFHYYGHEVTPGFLRLNLSLDSANALQFYQSIANDASLNFALTELMAQASAISKNNFDSLFVPLRVVTADIFSQSQVILARGSLSEALRATQTVPYFYTPIRINGKYLFDGGIYNNFPVDVAQETFNPDVVIGSNVSSKVYKEYPYNEDDKLISRSFLYMLLDKSDPSVVPDSGVYIQPDLNGYTALDFVQAKALIDSGYIQTLRQIDEIKTKIRARQTCDEVAEKRNAFNNRSVPFVFSGVTFRGFNSNQQRYIRRIFNIRTGESMSLAYLKKGYFNLVSEPYFSNVFPTIQFSSERERFMLQLAKRPQKNFQVDFGGVMASRNISNLYLGLNYYYFNRSLTHAYLGAQVGSFYKSVAADARIDYPFLGRFYVQPEAVYNEWDYVEGIDLLQRITPTVLKRFDRSVGINMGWPISLGIKSTVSVKGFSNLDKYSNEKKFSSLDTLDELRTRGFITGFELTSNNLNRKQYASSGRSLYLGVHHFSVKENYLPGTTSFHESPFIKNHQWFRLRGTVEQYFSKGWYRTGLYADAVFSNQPFFRNYFGTIINAPAFTPLQDSRTLILENFRSFNYAAFGLRNVFILRQRLLDFRLEGYLFKPIEYIQQNGNQEAYTNTEITTVFFTGTAGLVYHSPLGPVSLSANYYDDAENRFGILFHVGYLLFNKHSLE
jgi:NTE family protein